MKWLMILISPLVFAQSSPQAVLPPLSETAITAFEAVEQPYYHFEDTEGLKGLESAIKVGDFDGIGVEESGLEAYIRLEAKNYGVSEDLATYIVFNESRYNPRAVGDTHLICPFTGEKQRSRGLWQWSDCFNPQVSDEQAFNFITSTELAMKELAKGEERCKQLWTTCRKYYAQTQTD